MLIEYLQNCFTPKSIFANRNRFKWWQNLFLTIFLNSLIMVPVTIHYANLKTYPLELIVKESLSPITQKTSVSLRQGTIDDNTYSGKSIVIRDGKVAIAVLPTIEQRRQLKRSKLNHIILTRDTWYFVTHGDKVLSSPVKGKKFSLESLKDRESVREFVNQQWFLGNKSSLLSYLLLVFGLVITSGNLVIIGLGTLFLTLTKKSNLFSIRSTSESFGVMVNCYALPTLLATLLSIFVHNPVLLMNCQAFGTLLMLTWVFSKTRFRDELS